MSEVKKSEKKKKKFSLLDNVVVIVLVGLVLFGAGQLLGLMVLRNLLIAAVEMLAPGASASMHRDIRAGKQSEVDGLVYEVVRLGQQYGVDVPTYEKIAAELHARLDRQ